MGPQGLLFDYGGTLVEEVSVDLQAGTKWLLSRAGAGLRGDLGELGPDGSS
jgi:hypothetical protein